MSNHLKMAIAESIHALARLGWSQRRIAQELGINRETVGRHLKQREGGDSNPAISTAGSEAESVGSPPPAPTVVEELDLPNPAISTAGDESTPVAKPAKVTAGRQSRCRGLELVIEEKLKKGLHAQRIWQDLAREHGFEGSYESVKRFVRKVREREPERVWRIECEPGEEVQVDFGLGAPIVEKDGKRRRSWVFRVILSFSRKGYSESVYGQDTETFIRCLENAFRHCGGVPEILNVDNLKAAVIRADWYDPDLNPKLEAFCRHYGTTLKPSRPYRPQDKGKVESGVKYVRHNALKGRTFGSLAEQNTFLRQWEEQVADCRIHGTTRQQVRERFEQLEKAHLKPLPIDLFPCYQEGKRQVHRDSLVEVGKALYEVPEEYIHRAVWVRWDSREVRISSLQGKAIITHVRLEPGRFSRTLGQGGRTGSVENAMRYWENKAQRLGPNCGLWANALSSNREGPTVRVIQGLCDLANKHRKADLDAACAAALSREQWRLEDVRRQLRERTEQEVMDFTQEHPLIRSMSDYAAITGNPFTS